MPFTDKDAKTGIGQLVIDLWISKIQVEELQEENKSLKEKLDLLSSPPKPTEVVASE